VKAVRIAAPKNTASLLMLIGMTLQPPLLNKVCLKLFLIQPIIKYVINCKTAK
jgi:hypothetical protein